MADLALGEPVPRLREIAAALRDGRLDLDSGESVIRRAATSGPSTVERVRAMLTEWSDIEPLGAGRQLGSVLDTLATVKDETERAGPHCELVWTGPVSDSSPTRRTDQVVAEMLENATRSVLVVSYSVWLGKSEAALVVDRLAAAARRGVNVTFIVDARYELGRSVREIQEHWPSDAPRPALWSYTREDDEIAKLHAKLVLVDGRDILVTSANLTGYGLSENLEFGLRVLGDAAHDAANHFDAVIASGTLERTTW